MDILKTNVLSSVAFAAMAVLLLLSCTVRAGNPERDVVFPSEDRVIAEDVLSDMYRQKSIAASQGKELSTADLMMSAAGRLMGTPYVAGTLDSEWNGEQLRIFLTGTDCILFVETCLDLARTVVTAENPSDASLDHFIDLVASTRYRTPGPEYSYSDRIHYTTEWIRRQEGTAVKDITLDLGGVEHDHPLSFMSAHSDRYPALCNPSINADMKKDLEKIRKVEEELNREPYTVIPKDRMASALEKVRSGDIICFVTDVPGLDISHVAIACVHDGRVGFIHASMNEGKVVTDSRTIYEYVRSRRNLSGIKVVRPL